jgi:PAS domain S-box-containing protein
MNTSLLTTIWPYLGTFVFLIALAWFSWRRGDLPGARPLVVACIFQSLWLFGALGELLAVDIATKIAWFKFQAIWKMPTVTATTCFALEYVNQGRWLHRRNLALLSVPPLLIIALVLTNDLHYWYFPGFTFAGTVQPVRSAANWLSNVYGMGLVLVNYTAYTWLFIRSPRHRWPVVFMAVGQLVGRVFYAVDLFPGSVDRHPDPLVLSLMVTVGTYAVALFGFRILDPLPKARQTAIEQMQDGMIVFDTHWQALSMNSAAERILDLKITQARGKVWSELLPTDLDAHQYVDAKDQRTEICVEMDAGTRYYALTLSRLQDYRDLTIGYLLMLRDVTEQHRAQTQLLEQQWAQAILQERKLLAQELHDGLAQQLGFFNMQAQAARLYLQSGQEEAAQSSVLRLAEVALEIQDETRVLIDNLLIVSFPSEGLCSLIHQAVTHFVERTDLDVSLEITDDLDDICHLGILPPAAGMQLLRILQEALTNIRKHAGSSSHISVQFKADDGQLLMNIEDNGPGFDPVQFNTGSNHFGLQVMGQRAKSIGGELTVHSKFGQGTRIKVYVPLNGSKRRTV